MNKPTQPQPIPREEPSSTPPGGMEPPILPVLTDKSERWLLEEAVRRSHHAWEAAATGNERIRVLSRSMDLRFADVDKRIAARQGSHPAIEEAGTRFLQLQLDEEDTKIRHQRFLLTQKEEERRMATQNRARAWSYVWKLAALLFAVLSAYLAAR